MPIIRWRPFTDVEELFDDFRMRWESLDLAVDVYEDKNNIVVEMNIPGIESENVDIEVEDNYLRICGSREEEEEKKEKHFYRREIRRGSFERVITLPAAVIADQAKAEFANGVLKVTLPKVKGKEPSKIKVVKK